jgi:hypothetical protein
MDEFLSEIKGNDASHAHQGLNPVEGKKVRVPVRGPFFR